MTRFYPVFARRSDGKSAITAKGKQDERNEPTPEQLDQSPDANGVSDFYREVGLDEAKHLDWRRKLGGMLAREVDQNGRNLPFGQEIGYILVSFPENYRLYEHVKRTEKDGRLELKNKTHAAGGSDRQDAYLYGHPTGRKKRYRSPAEFFPHLLWLATDGSWDPDNCTCKLCQPDDMDGPAPAPKTKEANPPPTLLRSNISGTLASGSTNGAPYGQLQAFHDGTGAQVPRPSIPSAAQSLPLPRSAQLIESATRSEYTKS